MTDQVGRITFGPQVQPAQRGNGLDQVITQVTEMRREFEELNGRLSESELAFAAEAKARKPSESELVAQIDCTFKIPGQSELEFTLDVYGRFTPARKGGREKGERPYEPDEEAGFVPLAVMLGETDILGDIGNAGEDAIVRYVMENCQ